MTPEEEFDDWRRFFRQERLRLDLTYAEVAERMGVSHPNIHSWERGTSVPLMTNFMGWAQALGYEVVIEERARD
jgi:transcriptional regulator with XRE-family HTH domain